MGEFKEQILEILKAKRGIKSTVRDTVFEPIINSIIYELKHTQGVTIDVENQSLLLFIVDYADYRYDNRDSPAMPRHLQWRMHNLVLSGDQDGV